MKRDQDEKEAIMEIEVTKFKDQIRTMNTEIEDLQVLVSKDNELEITLTPSSENVFRGHKLVHLDLKGAPPLIDYLVQFVKLAKTLGATGFLIEYEDMFPWSGKLEILRRNYAYSVKSIKRLLDIIKNLGMIVIPLIQTFGHLEFVLKHKEFKSLRETEDMFNAICPLNPESLPLMKNLVDQVIALHPNSRWIHLGGDEVFNLKTCSKCKASRFSKMQLYKKHMIPLFEHVSTKKTSRNETLRPIIWDDMMLRWPVEDLKEIAKYADPMWWSYPRNLLGYSLTSPGIVYHYAAGFKTMWVASAFKGASRPGNELVDTTYRAENHVSWLKLIRQMKNQGVNVSGIALTGWSRYNHLAAMCELLPVGTPSLALGLAILNSGGYDSNVHYRASKLLGYSHEFQLRKLNFAGYYPERSNFVGNDVLRLVAELGTTIRQKEHGMWYERGFFRPYQLKRGLVDPISQKKVLKPLQSNLYQLRDVKLRARRVLSKYFDADTVEEWIADKIDDAIDKVEGLVTRLKEVFDKQKHNL